MTISRRSFLIGTATLGAAAVTFAGMPAWGEAAAARDKFMQMSALLVNHRLDHAIGARIAAIAATTYPQLDAMMDAIIALAGKATAVEDFFPAIPAGPVQDFAHWVIFAWYTGCDSPKKDACVFSYEQALTYQTTKDAVAIPSYGFSGPNLWHRTIVPLTPLPSF